MKKRKIYYHYDLLAYFWDSFIISSAFLSNSARQYLKYNPQDQNGCSHRDEFCYICLKTHEENSSHLSLCQDCGEPYCDECFHTPQHDLCLNKQHTKEECKESGRISVCILHKYY